MTEKMANVQDMEIATFSDESPLAVLGRAMYFVSSENKLLGKRFLCNLSMRLTDGKYVCTMRFIRKPEEEGGEESA